MTYGHLFCRRAGRRHRAAEGAAESAGDRDGDAFASLEDPVGGGVHLLDLMLCPGVSVAAIYSRTGRGFRVNQERFCLPLIDFVSSTIGPLDPHGSLRPVAEAGRCACHVRARRSQASRDERFLRDNPPRPRDVSD